MITTDRDEHIGGHVTTTVRVALYEEARAQGLSASALMAKVITSYLLKRGYNIPEKEKKLCGC